MISRRVLVPALLCLLSTPVSAQKAPQVPGYWVSSVIALSAAAALDAHSSWGRYEVNPILGEGRFGQRALALKLGLTGGGIALQRLTPGHRRLYTILNFATAAALTAAAVHNYRHQSSARGPGR